MTARTKQELHTLIRQALDTPERRAAIAQRLGCSQALVYKIASAHGVPRLHRADPIKQLRGHKTAREVVGLTTVRLLLCGLDDETLRWVIDQTGPGETYSDALSRIITQARHA